MAGLNVPMIYGFIVSMLFTVFEGEDIRVEFDRRIVTFGLGVKLSLRRGDMIHSVYRVLDPTEFHSDVEAKVANHYVVLMAAEMHDLVKPKLNKKTDGKEEVEA